MECIMQNFFTSFTSGNTTSGQRNAWLAFLIAATIGLTCIFTCAMPFAAMATVAALTLSRKQAMLFMLATWATNQFVGFTFKGYPTDPVTLTWGTIMGVAALASAFAATAIAKAYSNQPFRTIALAATFITAFFAFQFVLLLANLTPIGTLDSFAFATKAKIALINVGGLGAIWLANRAAVGVGALPAPKKSAPVAA